MTLLRTLTLVAVAVSVSALAGRADDKPNLDGTYVATAGEREGKPIPDDQLKGINFRFDGEKLVISDRTGKELHKCTHTIDTSAKPWKIVMKVADSAGEKNVTGLVEKNGDVIRIVYPLAGGETPTEFKAKEKQEMYTLKKQ